MKNRILIIALLILSVFLLLAVYSNYEKSSGTIDTTETVKTGKYFGVPYNITSSFIPIITLEDNDKFTLELGINRSITGTYKIDKKKLILTSPDGNESYTLSIFNNELIIEQEIYNYVKKGTYFKLAERK